MERQPLTHILVRLPEEVNIWLEGLSKANLRSKNSEIILALRKCMDSPPQ